jgi:LCP family protein required for cell wall assembly
LNAPQNGGAERPRSAPLATFLSFLWPGLGQWYLGRNRSALVYGLPVLAVLVIVVVESLGGLDLLALQLFIPSTALTVLFLFLLFGAWRLLSMGDALVVASGRNNWRQPRRLGLFGVLAAIVIVVHASGAILAYSFYDASTHVFVDTGPDSNPDPNASGPTPTPTGFAIAPATPLVTPATSSSRITVLLTGIDSGGNRDHALNDTILVVSLDPATGKVAMLSFPRDISNFPLWNGGKYTGKINSLMTYAGAHRDQFPDAPIQTLVRELTFILGVPINYYAAIDLDGFRTMIDVVGGVDIVNDRAIADPTYGGWISPAHPIGFYLTAGKHHLDGEDALAYARSRKGNGDNDFTRARRQQQLLVAIEKKLTDPSMLPKLPAILKAASDSVRTNFPADGLSNVLSLAKGVDENSITQKVLGPPYAINPPPAQSGGTYQLWLQMDLIAKLSVTIFGTDSAYAAAANGGPAVSPSAAP